MDDREQFMIAEAIIAIFLLGITLIELFDPVRFDTVVNQLMQSTSWFLGLTVGIVTSGILKSAKSKLDDVFRSDKKEGKFIFFLTSIAIFALIATVAGKFVLVFLQEYSEFFHLIFVQWFVLVYIWYKFSNKFEISAKYVITTQLIILVCALIVVWRLF